MYKTLIERKSSGFSLIEFMIYIAIFAVSSTFLIAILVAVTRVEVRQSSSSEVDEQIRFVQHTVNSLVKNSSLIDIPVGVETDKLFMYMGSLAKDPVEIYIEDGTIYLREGADDPVALTNNDVVVDEFSVIKKENSGGGTLVQVDIVLRKNTADPREVLSRSVSSVVARVKASTFDSDVLPNTDGFLNMGNPASRWNNAYFSGKVGIGTALPSPPTKLKVGGDIAFSDDTQGLILMSSGGSCFRLGVSDGGVVETSAVSCP
jgi:type II secretory pathway pseudopilin PulG